MKSLNIKELLTTSLLHKMDDHIMYINSNISHISHYHSITAPDKVTIFTSLIQYSNNHANKQCVFSTDGDKCPLSIQQQLKKNGKNANHLQTCADCIILLSFTFNHKMDTFAQIITNRKIFRKLFSINMYCITCENILERYGYIDNILKALLSFRKPQKLIKLLFTSSTCIYAADEHCRYLMEYVLIYNQCITTEDTDYEFDLKLQKSSLHFFPLLMIYSFFDELIMDYGHIIKELINKKYETHSAVHQAAVKMIKHFQHDVKIYDSRLQFNGKDLDLIKVYVVYRQLLIYKQKHCGNNQCNKNYLHDKY